MADAHRGEVAYLELSDFYMAAREALGVDVDTAERITNDTLAGSALAAPGAGFGDFEKYPDFPTKVAVLMRAIVSNHPLPDGNKRTALLCAVAFAGINGFRWEPPPADEPDGIETAIIVEAAAAGSIPLEELRRWVSERLIRASET